MICDNLQLRSNGYDLDMSDACIGRYEDSSRLVGNTVALRRRMREEGHLYLPGWLDPQKVFEARRVVAERLAAVGFPHPDHALIDAASAPEYDGATAHQCVQHCPALEKLLYSGRMIEIFEQLLGTAVAHFDWTWLRAILPGAATPTHCDVVYMGRGAQQNLYTAWTPLGDIDLAMGGLMILERSHCHERLRRTYCTRDVDAYCENQPNGERNRTAFGTNGTLAPNPHRVRRTLGGRWLVGQFQAGDLIIFNVFMVHGGLENQSNRLRLSTDTRYQPADELRDERWIGHDPITHGPAAKRGMVC